MDVRQLEYFLAVADELNFTRAAARCHVAQSALSYQIARLERQSGVLLFERTSRSVRLAPAAMLLLPRARRIVNEIDSARSELAALSGVISGRLRIGMIGSTATAAPVVERTLAHFHHRHPGVEIAIGDTGSRRMADQVRDGDVDLAFVGLFDHQVPADLVHHLLAEEPLVVVVEHGAAPAKWSSRTGVGAEQVSALGPLIEMRPESGVRRQVDEWCERAGVARSIAFELSTSDAVVRFVGLGFGAAVVPQSAVAGRSDVEAYALADPRARHPIGLIHRRPEPAAPAARALLDMLLHRRSDGCSRDRSRVDH